MTWSIVARDSATGAVGVIVATRNFAVGNRVPAARSHVGAVASQSYVNPFHGPRALALLEAGTAPSDAIAGVLRDDSGVAYRQLHLIDARGVAAAHTGSACIGWCGHRTGEGFSVAGNMLTGPAVLAATARTFQSAPDRPLAERLLDAMDAGQNAGGDNRGQQSAALLICSDESYPDIDIRVDDHALPLGELRRLLALYRTDFEPTMALMPSRSRPDGVFEADERNDVLARRRRELGLDL